MRPAELAALAACALAVVSAQAHGVHDLLGEARLDAERLVVEVSVHEGERCLRLLNELHVRAADGTRLTGIEDFDEDTRLCRLAYPLSAESGALTLRLQPAGRGLPRNERLVLVPVQEAAPPTEALVLTTRGNSERLPPAR